MQEAKPTVAGGAEADVHIDGVMRVQVLVLVHVHVQVLHVQGHGDQVAEAEEELPVAEQDVQGGFGIEEEQVQVQVQEVVQSVGASGYPVSVGHVPSVEPELDATQRCLEGSGP